MALPFSRRRVARTVVDRLMAGEDSTKAMQQLAAYLFDHRDVSQADRYVAEIEHELGQRGYILADVTTAHPLDGTLRTAITRLVGKDARQVELREHVDTQLIGGVIISARGQTMDASISGTLKRLRTS